MELGMILLSARTVWLSVQRDDGKCGSLKWTRNHVVLHHHPAMILEMGLRKTQKILLEGFLVLLLGLVLPDLRRMFSEPDLLQIVWPFHCERNIDFFSPPLGVNTSFALSLLARISDASIFPIPQCLRPKCLLSRFLSRIIHNQGIFLVRLSCRTDAAATGLWQKYQSELLVCKCVTNVLRRRVSVCVLLAACSRLWWFWATHGLPLRASVYRGYWPGPTDVPWCPGWHQGKAPTLCGWCGLEVMFSWTGSKRCVVVNILSTVGPENTWHACSTGSAVLKLSVVTIRTIQDSRFMFPCERLRSQCL